jgi:hypothetical protein
MRSLLHPRTLTTHRCLLCMWGLLISPHTTFFLPTEQASPAAAAATPVWNTPQQASICQQQHCQKGHQTFQHSPKLDCNSQLIVCRFLSIILKTRKSPFTNGVGGFLFLLLRWASELWVCVATGESLKTFVSSVLSIPDLERSSPSKCM